VVYPTLNYQPDPDFPLENLTDKAQEIKTDYVLHNSFGFGGTNCCTVLGKP
jgi:3-oxoacyl-[acyl-carrier-protein] synthase II